MTINSDRQIALWLFVCCFFVFGMIVIGGLTRLTDSGLSMANWNPVTGTFPPMNEVDWNEEFSSYKETPEYKKINKGMSGDECIEIFWMEWLHRFMGRITGLVFIFPFLFFLARGQISPSLGKKLFGIFVLGGVQAGIGWYMVKSGLVDDPMVSPYRLTFHLGTAFLIFGILFLAALSFCENKDKPLNKKELSLQKFSFYVTGFIFIQILLGGFVAGLDAGLTYNTFPLMDGKLVPEGLWLKDPLYVNFFENVTMVQFNHRWFAFVVLALVVVFWIKGSTNERIRFPINLLLGIIILQMCLGIATLLMVVPVTLASMHQALASILFLVSLFINWKLCVRVRAPSGI